jgi:succinoglycan biosynthesis protein ExoA
MVRRGSSHPRVSVVMPVRNERPYLPGAIEALQRQTLPRDEIEILVVDGGSSDGTTDYVLTAAREDPRISLYGGPGVNCPAGLNIGIRASRGAYVAKVDGHGFVNREFLETAVSYLQANPDVGCVGGVVVPIATTPTERANAVARFSRLGVGGGVYTAEATVQEFDTVQCGVYRREALEQAGGFDESLQFGEDEEANYRVRQAGWKIVLHPGMRYSYYIRPTLQGLFRQYRNYGEARAKVVLKHPAFLRLRHTIPAALVVALAASAVAAVVDRRTATAFALIWGGYLGIIAVSATVLSIRNHHRQPWRVAASLLALHLGYGVGSLRGLAGSVLRRGAQSSVGG